MLFRQDINHLPTLPPRAFLEQVMDGVTRVYCWLWDHQDKESCIDATWGDVTKVHSKTAFRSSVRKLGNHGLLSCCEDDEGVHIQLVGWDEVMDSFEDEEA